MHAPVSLMLFNVLYIVLFILQFLYFFNKKLLFELLFTNVPSSPKKHLHIFCKPYLTYMNNIAKKTTHTLKQNPKTLNNKTIYGAGKIFCFVVESNKFCKDD